MQLELYNFSKRKNSTARPSSPASTRTVYMKRETSVTNPRFLISNVNLNYNYCKFDGMYYFIDDIVLNDDDMYEIVCSIDPLATAKEAILNTTAEVSYCTDSDKHIIDTRIPILSDPVNVFSTPVNFTKFTIKPNSLGEIVLGITGKGSFGAYLLANNSDLTELLDGVDNWWQAIIGGLSPVAGITGVFSESVKQLIYGGSASECLKSAIALPIELETGTVRPGVGTYEDLYLGNYPCTNNGGVPIAGFHITHPIVKETLKVKIPWRYEDGDWRNCAPYTMTTLYLPFAGLVQLPSTDLIGNKNIDVTYAINLTSGDFSIEVRGYEIKKHFATLSGNFAMATAYGSTGIDTNKLTNAVVAGAGAVIAGAATVATGGAAAPAALGIAGGLAAAATGTLDAMGGSGFGSGGLGGGASQGLETSVYCFCTTRTLTDEPDNLDAIMGKPYFAKAKISDIKGELSSAYVQTDGFSLHGNYLKSVIDSVNSMMDAGVYIE